MTFETWALFFAMETALSLSPGPAVFYVVSQGARGGLGRALPATLGILSVNALFFALSATGLGAVMAASERYFAAVKWVGAGYLAYLAVKSLRGAGSAPAVPLEETLSAAPQRRGPVYRGAVMLQLANPKALLFFIALLPQFIDPRNAMLPQMALLAGTSILPEFCILTAYGWLAHRAACASARFGIGGAMNRWLNRIEGLGLLACAALVLNFKKV